MKNRKTVTLRYGRDGMRLEVPSGAVVLQGRGAPALADPTEAVRSALARPVGAPPLAELLAARRPKSVAITISDITRPVPNHIFLPLLLEDLNRAGVPQANTVVIIGTGMHRPSTEKERELLVGRDILSRVEVIDHAPRDPSALVEVQRDPPVRANRRFVEAEFRIVTGYIEPHFVAGFSGGRKGVCPALVDLETVQRFHGYEILAHPLAENGVLEGNPCHAIALEIARAVGVDFLLNVAITMDRKVAAVYAGDLEEAHEKGCAEVKEWVSALVEEPFDLVITSGGGFPLDQTFYQTVKSMCAALPALSGRSTLLVASHCGEGVGSPAYRELLFRYQNDWRRFVKDIGATRETRLDQWQFQLQARVLERIGIEKLRFTSDGIGPAEQGFLAVTPLPGEGDAAKRSQALVDDFSARYPKARIAAIPDGPYTLLVS
ncbi:MAG: nickel-dependent lactate racemase [Planctomycetota bacterium]